MYRSKFGYSYTYRCNTVDIVMWGEMISKEKELLERPTVTENDCLLIPL